MQRYSHWRGATADSRRRVAVPDASRIERAAGSLLGSDSRPAAILLTHCHPDHAGSALPLARIWNCASATGGGAGRHMFRF